MGERRVAGAGLTCRSSSCSSQTYAAGSPLLSTTDTAPLLLFVLYVEHLLFTLAYVADTLASPSPTTTSADRLASTALAVAANSLLVATALSFPLEPPLTPYQLAQRHAQVAQAVYQAELDEGEVGREPLMPSPERVVTLGSWLVFAWSRPMLKLAGRRKLEFPDVWELPEVMKAEVVWRVANGFR